MKRLTVIILLLLLLLGCQSSPAATDDYSFVGSINSTVYHYPSCKWAKQIKPENEVWFSSAEEAQDSGYRPCKVCKPHS